MTGSPMRRPARTVLALSLLFGSRLAPAIAVSGPPTKAARDCIPRHDHDPPLASVALIPIEHRCGKPVAGFSGVLRYRDRLPGRLTSRVELRDVLPERPYLLSLNSKRGPDGRMLDRSSRGRESYQDIATVQSDAAGCGEAAFDVKLPAGHYDLKVLVKDGREAGCPVVLYNDVFMFTIK